MKTIYESDPDYISPLMKWGINVSKMRTKAFRSYAKNYNDALSAWPEFKEEFDYLKLMSSEKKPKRNLRKIGLTSYFEGKKFLRLLLSN